MRKHNIFEVLILGMAIHGGAFQTFENLFKTPLLTVLTLINIVIYSIIANNFINAREE